MQKAYKIFYPDQDYIDKEDGGWEMKLKPFGPKFSSEKEAEDWLSKEIHSKSTLRKGNNFLILSVYSK
ncbi:MAG TPA: hypothetical protein VL098_02510 [Flavipsychrobacter sp.]|nr:hypothetical protein [Flavipsychrobacter sp.]